MITGVPDEPLTGGKNASPNGPERVGPYEPSAAFHFAARGTVSGTRGSGRSGRSGTGDQDSRDEIATANGPTLRSYQLAAISAVQAEFERGIRRTLLVLPTGTGKTVVFADLARRVVSHGDRVLVLAHRTELLEQAQRKLSDVGVWAAIEKAERRAGFAPVVVASVQTLQRKRLEALDPKQFGLVVVDEGHHAPARSYREILAHFERTRVLLVTATPDRADGKALGEICESVAYSYELRDAIRDGWLAPIRARRIVVAGVDLSKVRSRAGDLANDELAKIMAEDTAVLGTVVPLLEQAGDRRTIVFAVDVAHAFALASALRDRRAACARVAHGEMEPAERAEILADFRAGRFQFLVNVALFTEGFDEPSLQCVAVARPTKSRALFVQMVGRGTRLFDGKPDCLVLDFTGNAGKHKLVGPLDALAPGAGIEADLRSEAERLLTDEEQDLDGLLDEAQQALDEKRKAWRQSATAKYFAKDVDPFFGAELEIGPLEQQWAGEPATQYQREQIAHMRNQNPHAIPAGLSMGEASRIIVALQERKRRGLVVSHKQATWLHKYGLDTRAMTFKQACDRMAIIASNDWALNGPKRARCLAQLEHLEAKEREA
jgi:superfamily II DNA or RNA helicase